MPDIQAKVTLTAEDRASDVVARAAESFNRLDQGTKQATGGVGQFNLASIATIATGVSVANVAEKMVSSFIEIGKGALLAADALEAIHNRAQVVFGSDFEQMRAQAEALGQALNRDGSDILGFETHIAAIAEGLGVGKAAAQEMSTGLSQLAVDFGKAFHTSDEQAMFAIQRALEGNTRALREYDIVLNASTLQEYADAEGIRVKVSHMDEQQKAILTYHYLMDKTHAVQAAAIRDTGGLDDSLKGLKARWKEFEEVLGGPALGIASGALQLLTGYVQQQIDKLRALESVASGAVGVLGSLFSSLAHLAGFSNVGLVDVRGPALRGLTNNLGLEDLNAALEKNSKVHAGWAQGWKDHSDAAGTSAAKKLEEVKIALDTLSNKYDDTTHNVTNKLNELDSVHKDKVQSMIDTMGTLADQLTTLDADYVQKTQDLTDQFKQTMDDRAAKFKETMADMNTQNVDKVADQFQKVKDLFDRTQTDQSAKDALSSDQIISIIANRADKDQDKLTQGDIHGFNLTSGQAQQVNDSMALRKEQQALAAYLKEHGGALTDTQKQGLDTTLPQDFIKNAGDLLKNDPALGQGIKRMQESSFTRYEEDRMKKGGRDQAAFDEANAKTTDKYGDDTKKTDEAHAKKQKQLQEEMDKLQTKINVEAVAYGLERTQLINTQTQLTGFHDVLVFSMGNMAAVTKGKVKEMQDALQDLAKTYNSVTSQIQAKNTVSNTSASQITRILQLQQQGSSPSR